MFISDFGQISFLQFCLFVVKVDDELKKIKPKDPKLMTARQRAMLERKTTDKELSSPGEQLLALPTGQLVA